MLILDDFRRLKDPHTGNNGGERDSGKGALGLNLGQLGSKHCAVVRVMRFDLDVELPNAMYTKRKSTRSTAV